MDPAKRLGCLKGGSLDVKSHEWFTDLSRPGSNGGDWKALETKPNPPPHACVHAVHVHGVYMYM